MANRTPCPNRVQTKIDGLPRELNNRIAEVMGQTPFRRSGLRIEAPEAELIHTELGRSIQGLQLSWWIV